MLGQRRALRDDEVFRLSNLIQSRVTTLTAWHTAREVLLYLPVNNEVDTWPLIRSLWKRGVRALLPCCRPEGRGEMDLACVTGEREIKPGAYGIPEPDLTQCSPVPHFRPDLGLIPGVGFDRRGYRIGHGAGYYDRFLARPEMKNTLLVGLGYAFQLVDHLPNDPWDRPVHLVVTDREEIRAT